MHPLAVILVLCSGVIHAWRELITKKAYDKQVFVWLFCSVASVMFLPVFVYEAYLGHVTGTALLLGLCAGVIHACYWYVLSKAYEGGDLSHVYPIMRSSPALVFIISVLFLHEVVSGLAVAGVVTIITGIYMINMKKISFHGFLEPLESLKEKHTQFALLAACATTFYSIQDKIMVEHIDPLLYSYFVTVIPLLYWTPFLFWKKPFSAVKREWNRSPRDVFLNAVIGFVSYTLILYALTIERVSYVTSLRQISIVVGVLLGGHILKERHKWIRLSAAGLIFVGTIMIAVAN